MSIDVYGTVRFLEASGGWIWWGRPGDRQSFRGPKFCFCNVKCHFKAKRRTSMYSAAFFMVVVSKCVGVHGSVIRSSWACIASPLSVCCSVACPVDRTEVSGLGVNHSMASVL